MDRSSKKKEIEGLIIKMTKFSKSLQSAIGDRMKKEEKEALKSLKIQSDKLVKKLSAIDNAFGKDVNKKMNVQNIASFEGVHEGMTEE